MALNFDEVADVLSDLAQLNFFPADEDGRLSVQKSVGLLASDIGQVKWLVAEMLRLYNRWPGPAEMRSLFCQRYRPADGRPGLPSEVFENGVFPPLDCAATVFYDGLPPVPPRPALPAPGASDAERLDEGLSQLAPPAPAVSDPLTASDRRALSAREPKPWVARPWPEDELAIAREGLAELLRAKRQARPLLALPEGPGPDLQAAVKAAEREVRMYRSTPHEFESEGKTAGGLCRRCWLPADNSLHLAAVVDYPE